MKAAHSLSDLLGDEHDLVVFQETMGGDAGTLWDPSQVDALSAMAERRRSELLADALPLGRRLYKEKPARFIASIRGYWEAALSEMLAREERDQAVGA